MTPGHVEEDAIGKVYDAELLARLWPFLRPYRGLLLVGFLFVPLRMIVQLLPPLLFGVGVAYMIGEEPTATLAVLDGVIGDLPGLTPLGWVALALFVVTIGGALVEFGRGMALFVMGQRAMRDLRATLFAHVQRLPMRFFDAYPVGRLVTRLTNDAESLSEMFTGGIVELATDLVAIVAIAVVLFWIDPELAIAAMAVVPVLAVAAVVFRWRVREAYRAVRVKIAAINAHLQETISGMKEVQLFAREARNYREFDELNRGHRNAWFTSIQYDAYLSTMIEFAVTLTSAFIFWQGAKLLDVGAIGFDVLFAFVEYMKRFFQPLQDLSARYSVMQSSMASLERIAELMDVPEEEDAAREVGAQAEPRPGASRGEVVFDDVTFGYNDEPVLRNVSLRVAPGERVAIVGHTGSGKTTLLKLLARLYDVGSGSIRIDGRDVRELPRRALRGRMAFVLQDVFLFSGDLEYNLSLGRPEITRERIEAAARAAHVDGLIARLPGGYAQEVRERGLNFSGGERQLLSFARALAQDPDILLLDEATSSVDTETEALIQDALHQLLSGKTSIVVAHRLSTIQDVDRIYVMHQGEIVEQGTHEELLALRGRYWRLYQLQYAKQARSAA